MVTTEPAEAKASRFKNVVNVHVLITPQQDRQLDRLSEERGESRSTLVRLALNEFLKQESAQ